MAHRQRAEGAAPADKTCVACGRRIQWRAKWARDWDAVKYCSDACRRRGVTEGDRMLEAAILALLAQRPTGATILDSDAAREVGGEDWQQLAEPARRAARRLSAAGQIDILQSGSMVDASTAKGPLQLRRR
ncbi:DUF3253 domain-containing protein [Glaciihabitans sp. INWT7]|uniref:DUF2256 and DUF3253 domain-containing protein n=1 Tax=Glaciihabitans sp. INWT7 TaxID=2596912 RepID=UPI0016289E8F|nr:DUF2256 and DUF3253 domain-containing protein [Glaciihabitans sp. INWT7]QNE48106.1 DUF3253 domain-containing protein [Glaciihabitans sp. INWT7]